MNNSPPKGTWACSTEQISQHGTMHGERGWLRGKPELMRLSSTCSSDGTVSWRRRRRTPDSDHMLPRRTSVSVRPKTFRGRHCQLGGNNRISRLGGSFSDYQPNGTATTTTAAADSFRNFSTFPLWPPWQDGNGAGCEMKMYIKLRHMRL